MADEASRASQYQYAANSNLVLQADRSELPRRVNEPSGEPESLWGRIDPKEMGSRVRKDLSNIDPSKPSEDKSSNSISEIETEIKNSMSKNKIRKPVYGYDDALVASENLDGSSYVPQTMETREIWSLILEFIKKYLGDQSEDVIYSASEETLQVLKDVNIKDLLKKKQIEQLLDTKLAPDQFTILVNLGKQIVDFNQNSDDDSLDKDLDEKVGVAVVFEDGDSNSEIDDLNDDENEDIDDDLEDLVISSNAQLPKLDQPDDLLELETPQSESLIISKPLDLDIHQIDAFWIQRKFKNTFKDDHTAQEKSEAAMLILESTNDPRVLENKLVELFEFNNFEVVRELTTNRDVIVWGTRWARLAGSDKAKIDSLLAQMAAEGLKDLADKLVGSIDTLKKDLGKRRLKGNKDQSITNNLDDMDIEPEVSRSKFPGPSENIDLDAIGFTQGARLMSNKNCKLPDGSFKQTHKGYEEIFVPAPKPPTDDHTKIVKLTELPRWAQKAFPGTSSFNKVQSKVFKCAYGSEENMLVCAPTGAGKTNVAMLTMLRTMQNYINDSGELDTDAFKIVYIAPMKALVAEIAGSFSKRLEGLKVTVNELTGDSQLTKDQIESTQVIVTTPEKWDVITRKANERSYTRLVRLVIIDEIHLLHDTRGPVLEALVSRTIRTMEQTQERVRLVGLSATLPNYEDVAAFLRVNPRSGLFYFNSKYRPCPLQQSFVGITEKKAIKRLALMNEITFNKVSEQAGKNQVLVFVHARKETAKTATWLRDMAIERQLVANFVNQDGASREILLSEAESTKDQVLKDILPYGFAVHHAGMTRVDRTLVEELFADGHIQVLVSTATLAWGVNLPAHSVIIKGTQVYSPEQGCWTELSPQDILQMLGRAGRPQYDTFGEGTIITTHNEIQYYLSLLNQQLPIESQLAIKLPDNLNAEISLGSIQSRAEAVQWLGYSYLYVRMLRNPTLYGCDPEQISGDPTLIQRRVNLIHAACLQLEKAGMIRYEHRSGKIQPTELGRVASNYYVQYRSMTAYRTHLRPTIGDIDLIRIFGLSSEFHLIPVRADEKQELKRLLERVPVPVKESIDDPVAKISVLLQSYIARLHLDGFALVSDMVYVTQSAARLMRAIFEICLRRGWASAARKTLDWCKQIEKRQWLSMSPLRQFGIAGKSGSGIPADLLRRVERKNMPWDRLLDMDPSELGEWIGVPRAGRLLHKLIYSIPRVDIRVHVQPWSRGLVHIELTITPDMRWDEAIHGNSLLFWVLVESADGEKILHTEQFILKQIYSESEHIMEFVCPLLEPLPPHYFVSVISDRWLASETRVPVSFRHMILPEKFSPPTELLDMQLLPITALNNPIFEAVYSSANKYEFDSIQTQTFHSLYTSDSNIFIGCSSPSTLTVCAELALMRLWANQENSKDSSTNNNKTRAVYISLFSSMCERRARLWEGTICKFLGKRISTLTGETSSDLKILETSDIVCCTPSQWDNLTRRWKQRKIIHSVRLAILDRIEWVGGGGLGTTVDDEGGISDAVSYEVVASRIKYITAQLNIPIRILALSVPLADAKDISSWLGVSKSNTYNFHPMVRPTPLDIHIQSHQVGSFDSIMLSMVRPVYAALTNSTAELDKEISSRSIVYVANRKQARLTAAQLLTYSIAEGTPERFLLKPDVIKDVNLSDKKLEALVLHGIAYYFEEMEINDRRVVEALFINGAIGLLVASREMCWDIDGSDIGCDVVVIMGTQYYVGRQHRYVDYPIPQILQMMSSTSNTSLASKKCVLMCPNNKKEFYKKFMYEPLPIESRLDSMLHDTFNAEIVTRTISTKQDAVDYMTWTFLYRRLLLNPNYYGLQGTDHTDLSDYLSELVETTLNDLSLAKCITLSDNEEEDVEEEINTTNLGMIASYYQLRYVTVEMLSLSLSSTTKLRGVLDIICAADEFEQIPIRHKEQSLLSKIVNRVLIPVPTLSAAKNLDGESAQKNNTKKYSDTQKFNSPRVKTHLLLQAYFSRLNLPFDLMADQKWVISRVPRLLQAVVDVSSSQTWINPALAAMELSQMVIQAIWIGHDQNTKQIPYFDLENQDFASKLKRFNIDSVYDVMSMEDEDREILFEGFSPNQVAEIATYANRYPTLGLSATVEPSDPVSLDEASSLVVSRSSEAVSVNINIDRDLDQDDIDEMLEKHITPPGPIIAPFYPFKKDEAWWVVITYPESNSLVAVKRVTISSELEFNLQFEAPSWKFLSNKTLGSNTSNVSSEVGSLSENFNGEVALVKYKLYLMCDSYAGCDQEVDLELYVVPNNEDSESDEDDSESGGDEMDTD
ncbi:U5 small nuclear ribonucleoprotein 200 kDa helicase [Smittium mucronatum]|uniref:U5 small nuclear ribonucleoprotein 200 kDa helicase n=1 Tax=Smittium mucronatum TaxID=133383 RepID=A0A1R0GXU5_9FUNG|nr:U5 small nuclear ribonucleoprotein 200 kDa helicase [Smittium mucronatum]